MWFGVSVEDGTKKSRIRHLQDAPAGVRFLSIEPLIGPVGTIDLTGIDWVKALSKQLDAQVVTVSGALGTKVSVTHATFAAA
jgi:protein gp37